MRVFSFNLSTRSILFTASAALALGLVSCATTTPGAKPDDMSAEEHRREASQHSGMAADEQQKYDPSARETRLQRTSAGRAADLDIETQVVSYNPTKKYLDEAKKHRHHAEQHLAAAQALEKFEDEQCAVIPVDKRPYCPLLGVVDRVEDVSGGARLVLDNETPVDVVVAHLRCHYAYGRKVGREGMNMCPMYLKDLTIERSGDHSVDITASDSATIRQIRERSRAHVSGSDTP